ncbi:MAG: hypothetical protein HYZ08_00300 [Candidatus Kerfeldbacteria bacterium]|nr:hypothetical protein [Candidatus Kerfeldbacteria bacterium]
MRRLMAGVAITLATASLAVAKRGGSERMITAPEQVLSEFVSGREMVTLVVFEMDSMLDAFAREWDTRSERLELLEDGALRVVAGTADRDAVVLVQDHHRNGVGNAERATLWALDRFEVDRVVCIGVSTAQDARDVGAFHRVSEIYCDGICFAAERGGLALRTAETFSPATRTDADLIDSFAAHNVRVAEESGLPWVVYSFSVFTIAQVSKVEDWNSYTDEYQNLTTWGLARMFANHNGVAQAYLAAKQKMLSGVARLAREMHQ